MIDGIPKLEGQFRLFIKYPNAKVWMMVDDRWKFEKLDEQHYRVSPSLMMGNQNDEMAFHTLNPFIVELGEPKLTIKRNGED